MPGANGERTDDKLGAHQNPKPKSKDIMEDIKKAKEPTPAPSGDAPIISTMSKRDPIFREIVTALNKVIKPAENLVSQFSGAPFGSCCIIDTTGIRTKADAVLAFMAAIIGTNCGAVVFDPRNEIVVKRKDETRSAWDNLGEALNECIYARLTKEQRDAWVAMATLYAIHRDENGGEA